MGTETSTAEAPVFGSPQPGVRYAAEAGRACFRECHARAIGRA